MKRQFASFSGSLFMPPTRGTGLVVRDIGRARDCGIVIVVCCFSGLVDSLKCLGIFRAQDFRC